MHLKKRRYETQTFTMIATLGAPQDTSVQELRIECAFPIDDASVRFFKDLR